MPARTRWLLFLLGLALFAAAALAALTPPKGELRTGTPVPYRVGSLPETSLVLAARDTDYCGHHKPCGPGKRTDTILYVHLAGNQASLIAIPRDLYVDFEGITGKINAVYGRAGADGLRRAVEQVLGLPVEHYLVVTLDSIAQAIDGMGGIEVELAEPMRYTDTAARLYIDFPAGRQQLDGDATVRYLRFRYGDGSDYGRLDRVKGVLSKLVHKAGQPQYWPRLPGLLDQVLQQVETSLTASQLAAFLPYLRDPELRSATLPTFPRNNGLSYDPVLRAQLVQGLLGSEALPADFSLPVPAETQQVPARVVILDAGQDGAGQALVQGYARLGLPAPELRLESPGLPNGIYLYASDPRLTEGRRYAEAARLPLFTRYRYVVYGFDLAIVVGGVN